MLGAFTACNQSKSTSEKSADKQQPATNDQKDETSTPATTGANSDIVGEWPQEYAVFDQNANGKLEPEDRNGTKSNMGFNWFRFNSDGSCQYDSDMKFKGTYEVLGEPGNRKLNVTVNGFGETYKYNIIEPVTDELVLYSTGVFMIFKKK